MYGKLLTEAYKAKQERDLVKELIIKYCPCDINKEMVYSCTFEAIHRAMIEYHKKICV